MTGRREMLTGRHDWAGLLCLLLAAMLLVLAATLPHRSYGAGLFGVDEAGKGSDDRPATTAETKARLREQAKQQQYRVVLDRAIAHCGNLIASGKHREAYPLLVELRKMIGEPRDVRVEALLARVALAEKRPDKALEFVGAYAEKRNAYDANLADGYLAAADAHLAAENSYKALEIFDWVAGSAQGVPLVLAAEGCGKALLARKEYQTAVEAIEFALGYARSRYYDRPDLVRRLEALLGEARRLADSKGEPQDTFDRAERFRTQGKFREALDLYETIVKGYPGHALRHPAGHFAGICLAGMKKYDEALKRAVTFIDEAPEGPWRGQAHLLVGDLLLEHFFDARAAEWHYAAIIYPGLLKKGGEAAKEAAKGRPFNPPAHLADMRPDPTWADALPDAYERLGLCFYLRGRLDVAEKYLAEELRLRPTRKLGAYTIGSNLRYLLDMCRQKKNPVYFKEHVLAGDRRVQTLLFLASAYLEAGDTAKALSLLERLGHMPLAQAATAAQKAYAQMETAEALRLSFRFQEALKALEKFEGEYQAMPMAPMALMDKAALLLSLDDKPAALVTYQRIYTLYPHSEEVPKALYYAGYVYYFTEEWQKALAAFRLLRSRYPKTWEAGRVSANEIPELEERSANQAKR